MMPKMRKEVYFKKSKSRNQDKIGKARKYEKQESSEKKESQKKRKKKESQSKEKQSKLCPLMGDLFSQVTNPSNSLNSSTLIL